jgi:hypothetical protein
MNLKRVIFGEHGMKLLFIYIIIVTTTTRKRIADRERVLKFHPNEPRVARFFFVLAKRF